MSKLKVLTKGLIRENPVLVIVLGTCPTLAVSTQASNAIGMGIAATFVLVCSNFVISLLRNVIPDKVRIPCYVVLIAGFVSVVQLLLEAYAYPLYEALGIYLPLIVVNCIILGRAEMFANKNKPLDSVLDGIGMGLGFTLTLFVMASIREILGSGTFFGAKIPWLSDNGISVLTMAPGGFIVFGSLMALVNRILRKKPPKDRDCDSCVLAGSCTSKDGISVSGAKHCAEVKHG
ncbi:MAG: electron transport complex subunit E [Oscillospiraceae bacterium]|jgi:electron transport complex protein RnfE|nr:electron transport complex subunit E [Oscillospiraceae bacterium]